MQGRVNDRVRFRAVAKNVVAAFVWAVSWLMTGCGASDPVQEVSVTKQSANVVVVVLDTLRMDRLSRMPSLEELGRDAWVFTNCISPASWTKPSMVSLFTGVFPQVHNVQWGVDQQLTEKQDSTVDLVPESFDMMAERFKKAGYRTVAVQSNANMQEHFGVAQGFDHYEFLGYPGKRGGDVTAAAKRFLDEATADPLFLYVHYMDAHQPYDPPASWVERELSDRRPDDSELALIKAFTPYYLDKVLFDVGINSEPPPMTLSERGRAYVKGLYDLTVEYLDQQMTELIAAIRALPRETIVVVVADHGEELWDHGSLGHGKTLFNEVIHVPLIVSIPGEAPARCDYPVQSLDVLPTLASLVGLPADSSWQGTDLRAAIKGERQDRLLFSETRASIKAANIDLQCVFEGPFKAILDRKTGRTTLYDMRKDPLEVVDEAAQHPKMVSRFLTILDAHQENCERNAMFNAATESRALSPVEIERLNSQGYLGGG